MLTNPFKRLQFFSVNIERFFEPLGARRKTFERVKLTVPKLKRCSGKNLKRPATRGSKFSLTPPKNAKDYALTVNYNDFNTFVEARIFD